MKILLVSSSSGSRGGGELYLLYLGRALAERGHEPILWASSHPRMNALAASFGAFGRVERAGYSNTYDRRLRSIGAFVDSKAARSARESWQRIGADFIHLNKQNLEDGLDLLRALTNFPAPSLCTIHLTQSARYLRAVLASARDAISHLALMDYQGLLVTVLENRRQDLTTFLGHSPRIRMIPNGVPLFDLSLRDALRENKRRELGIAKDERLIIAVGRLVPQKRPLVFLEQAARVSAKHSNVRFLWIGDGTMAGQWDQKVGELGIQKMVHRVSWQDDVPSFLHAADMFLHVAEFEGLPLAILEAMSAGLPCAISNHLLSEMPFFDEHSAIPVGDDDSWATALSEPSRLRELGRNARALAEREFSFETMAQRYEALYRETLDHSR